MQLAVGRTDPAPHNAQSHRQLGVPSNAGTESARTRMLAGSTHEYASLVAMIMSGRCMGPGS